MVRSVPLIAMFLRVTTLPRTPPRPIQTKARGRPMEPPPRIGKRPGGRSALNRLEPVLRLRLEAERYDQRLRRRERRHARTQERHVRGRFGVADVAIAVGDPRRG